ncbi:PD-(D/E)XK nuclease family protein [Halochromatium roseum]|uniref:PD-(D/E)XK nuclease family protein n=1 Tax=Halochromatium roseum TaxID=391920 RepID=UPI001914D914|nr:DUF3782 domain-containing protein [Halochromatium roseum]MBK5940434.1 hypothetical protein [Halochromatium roseum]
MIDAELKETIKRELPTYLREDPNFRTFVVDLTRDLYADRAQTTDWFQQAITEMREERARSDRRWEEYLRDREDQKRKWEEQNRKWDENQAELRRMNDALLAMAKKHDRSIGALGARWGLSSEKSFRDALASILEENFGVEVINYNGYDDSGEVFGKPEQIELDVIIKNGLLILCELKSSIDKGGMYLFERKARFYEREHDRQASRLIVISPMIEPKALKVAERLGIDCFGDSIEIERLEP